MNLIRRVEVVGFKSIRRLALEPLTDFNCLVGRNSSGKSNVLRALSLFFNNEVEPGRSVDFVRDYFAGAPKGKKKRISVAVDFDLPDQFQIPGRIASVRDALGRRFRIKRLWELDALKKPIDKFEVYVGDTRLDDNEEEAARQFLTLIKFRYLRNRTIPAAVLKEESRAIAGCLSKKAKGTKSAEDLISQLNSAGKRLIRKAAESMARAGVPLTDPALSTPATLGELLTVSGFQAVEGHGCMVQDEDWGSGHQSLFLLEILRSVDTDVSASWGWKQATVWGLEEPEAGLHRDLEVLLASEFRNWVSEPTGRMQILMSTHSPVFVMAASQGFWVELVDDQTQVEEVQIPRLVRDAQTRGVSSWVQPSLSFPLDPVVLVEGAVDAQALSHAALVHRFAGIRFFTLPELDPDTKRGGKDQTRTYLKKHGKLVHQRPREAPFLVLLDWETSDQEMANMREAYGGAAAGQRVLRMDASHCSPKLGPDFKGIERFYPPYVFRDADSAGELHLIEQQEPGRPWRIHPDEFRQAKGALLKRLMAEKNPIRLQSLGRAITDVEAATRGAGYQYTLLGVRRR